MRGKVTGGKVNSTPHFLTLSFTLFSSLLWGKRGKVRRNVERGEEDEGKALTKNDKKLNSPLTPFILTLPAIQIFPCF